MSNTTQHTQHVYFDPAYNDTDVGGNTFTKADHVAASLQQRPVAGVQVVSPRPSTPEDCRLVHAAEYIEALHRGEPYDLAASNNLGWDSRLFPAASASTGGVVQAGLRAMAQQTIAGSLSSGLHHARTATGMGYCTLNGLALAAVVARLQGARRVLILDLDAHCGGGTAEIIDGRQGIEQVDVSVVAYDSYRDTPNAKLQMATARDYLSVVERALDSIDDPADIDLVLYNAGMDPHERAGGITGIDGSMLEQREALVFGWAGAHALPVAWVLAGGYTHSGLPIGDLVDLHRLTIEAAAGQLAGHATNGSVR